MYNGKRIAVEYMPYSLLNHSEFVSIDIETTGFSREKGAEIIEIGASKFDIEKCKYLRKFSTLIKPRHSKIPAKITEITNISSEMVKDAPLLQDILPLLAEFIGDRPVICHNASFDWDRFLNPSFREMGIVINNDVIDTLALSKEYLSEVKEKKLESLCAHFGIEMGDKHRALADAKNTAKVAIKLRQLLLNQEIEPLVNSIEKDERPKFKVFGSKYWTKKGNGKEYERIYINSSWGNFFYDIKEKTWKVKTLLFDESVDFKMVERKVLNLAKVDEIGDLVMLVREQAEQSRE